MPTRAERRADPAALGIFAGLEERVATVSPDPSVVYLIPRDFRVPESDGPSLGTPQDFLGFERGLDGQEPEGQGFCLATLHTVLDAPSEHLVAAADAQGGQDKLRSFGEDMVDSARAEQSQVLDRRFGSWQDGKVSIEYLLGRLGERSCG